MEQWQWQCSQDCAARTGGRDQGAHHRRDEGGRAGGGAGFRKTDRPQGDRGQCHRGILSRRIREGEAFDVTVNTPAMIDELIHAGKIVAGSRIDLARVGVGVAVKQGAPLPDIGTLEAFKRTLIAARGRPRRPVGRRLGRHSTSRPCSPASASPTRSRARPSWCPAGLWLNASSPARPRSACTDQRDSRGERRDLGRPAASRNARTTLPMPWASARARRTRTLRKRSSPRCPPERKRC